MGGLVGSSGGLPQPVTGQIFSSGVALTPQPGFANIAASTTDGPIVTAVAGKKIRVIAGVWQAGATATNITYNSKGSGAGTAISPLFAAGANGGASLSFN